MTGLRAFIEARLAEDERVAGELAKFAGDGCWRVSGGGLASGAYELLSEYRAAGQLSSWHLDHIVRHDPARVLREVAHKRRVLARHAPVVDGTQSSWAWFHGSESASEEALREMAMVWSDHADYLPSWAS